MDRKRLQEAASGYPYLRGLLTAPAGVLLVAAALGNWSWGPLAHDWVFLAVVAAVGGVAALSNRYYNGHYGRVTPSAKRRARATAAGAASIVLMVGLSMLLRSRASWSLNLPVNAIAVSFGLLMLVYYASVIGLRAHHVAIWGTLLVAGALPVWTGADPSNIGLILAGVAVVVNGLLDHRLLVRLFAPPPSAAIGSANGR
jgi:hypothetical protein